MTTILLMVTTVKCIEILNHYVVYQELPQYHRSIILQKQPNSLTGRGRGEGN